MTKSIHSCVNLKTFQLDCPLCTEQGFVGAAVTHGGAAQSVGGGRLETPQRQRQTQRESVGAASDAEGEASGG